jgi:hypothetical protein
MPRPSLPTCDEWRVADALAATAGTATEASATAPTAAATSPRPRQNDLENGVMNQIFSDSK